MRTGTNDLQSGRIYSHGLPTLALCFLTLSWGMAQSSKALKLSDGGLISQHVGFVASAVSDGEPQYSAMMRSRRVVVGPGARLRVETPQTQSGIDVEFVDTKPSSRPNGQEPLAGRHSYFIGADPAKWLSGETLYQQVEIADLYPGIDLQYEIGAEGRLKSTFHVAPGADAAAIRWTYGGVARAELGLGGDLVIRSDATTGKATCPGSIVGHDVPQVDGADATVALWCEEAPDAWQVVGGKRLPIDVSYLLHRDGSVGFRVSDRDPSARLVIDPFYVFSTLLGGSLMEQNEAAVTVDRAGNIYVAGSTTSPDFPLERPIQATLGSDYASDMFLAQLTPNGDQLLFSTFFGGTGEEVVRGITVDDNGIVTVIGFTRSDDLPLVHPLMSERKGDTDWFIIRIDVPTGQLLFSTYLGGEREERPYGIVSLSDSSAAIIGNTASPDFPSIGALPGVRQGSYITGAAVLVVLDWVDDGARLRLSTHLPGIDATLGLGVGAAGTDMVYVVGQTEATNLPANGRFQSTRRGGHDAFVCGVPLASIEAIFCTYIGGSLPGGAGQVFQTDSLNDVAVDGEGNIWAVGHTNNADFPVRNPLQSFPRNVILAPAAVVTKFSPELDELLFGTFFGGVDADQAFTVDLDRDGYVYVSGLAGSRDFPQVSPLLSQGNMFMAMFDPSGRLRFSSYAGTAGLQHIFDGRGALAVSGPLEFVVSGAGSGPLVNPLQSEQRMADMFVSKINLTNLPTLVPSTETPTPTASSTPAPTPTRTGAHACDMLEGRVPPALIAFALANPETVLGWNQQCFRNRPPGPWNPRRQHLSLRDVGKPFHAMFNPLVFKCGCP
jgi:hypothetical protein